MEKTMKAVVYKGKGQVVLEDRPVPVIQDPRDAIVKSDTLHNLFQ